MKSSSLSSLIYNLHTSSHYSLLSSCLSINEIINFAKKNNQKFVSICDDNLYGAIEFYNKALENDMIPVIGISIIYKNVNLLIFAKNQNGYKNLIKISTHDKLQKEYDLNLYLKDVFVINNTNQENIDFLNTHFYNINPNYKNPIACNHACYLSKEDNKVLTLLNNIKNAVTIDSLNDLELNKNLHLLEKNEFHFLFDTKAIDNLNKEIETINLKIEEQKNNIINFENKEKLSSKSYLTKICQSSLDNLIFTQKIPSSLKNKYQERMEYELSVIESMGFLDYFLIVWDFVQEAKNKDILIGPGRGSAAGSLVAYLLNITEIDSIKYNLFFERFLNPGRLTMPDIDIDIMDIRRSEVIEYIFNKYGYNHVANIVTFQRMKPKSAIRDVARVLSIDLKIVNKITKLIPDITDLSFEEIIMSSKELKDYEKEFKDLFWFTKKIIGSPRQTGMHAAGIVLSKLPLDEIVPLQISASGDCTTQYSMEYLEQLGLLKMDILGLTNLTTIWNVLKLIKQVHKIEIKLDEINLEDQKVFGEISKADTMGIFQLESPGMRNLVKRLSPKNIEDISLCSALFRPGPQQNINTFLNRRNKKEKIEYIDERSKEILEPTYGILIYQEQVIELVKNVANFSSSEADIFRRIISKKNNKELNAFKAKFIDASIKNGYSEKHISDIYNYIFTFANYGFVHSHSIAYSLIGYWMSYLKTYFPKEFMITLMTSSESSMSRVQTYVEECKRLKIDILPPNINYSLKTFSIFKKKIMFGLNCIKGIGEEMSKKIISARNSTENKKFNSYQDAVFHLTKSGIGESTIELLIYANCFSDFDLSKKYMLTNLKEAIESLKNLKKDGTYLFDPNWVNVEETSDDLSFYFNKEIELIGVSFNENKTQKDNLNSIEKNKCEELITKYNISLVEDLSTSNMLYVNVLVQINSFRKIKTKSNKDMAFFSVTDSSGKLDLVCFIPELVNSFVLDREKYYVISLKSSSKNYQLLKILEVI